MRRLWPLAIILVLLLVCTALTTSCSVLAVVTAVVSASLAPADNVPARDLAFPDSRFAEVMGLEVHYREAGGGEPALLLLHGFGASTFSWQDTLPMLAEYGRVVAFDRPGFGLTERPLAAEFDPQQNPYSPAFQADLAVALLDELGIEQAILVGHSAGGATAVLTALRYPDRVQALVLVSPAVYEMGNPMPEWLSPLLRSSPGRQLGLLVARIFARQGTSILERAWADPSRITPEVREGYLRPLQVQGWDRGLWELVLASERPDLAGRLNEITVPALVITGDADRIVSPDNSTRVADALPDAELEVVPDCGHIAHEECPGEFIKLLDHFLVTQGLVPER